jgi:peptide deformylase
MEILKYPDERLRQVSQPVTRFDDKLHAFLDEMAVSIYAARGIGLAAVQTGRMDRLFIVDIGLVEENNQKLYEFINPEIVDRSGKAIYEEGCLSVPGFSERVVRAGSIRVCYQDRFGKSRELVAENLLGVAIQHEADHLDGILFIDRLSPIKRRLLKRKIDKQVLL